MKLGKISAIILTLIFILSPKLALADVSFSVNPMKLEMVVKPGGRITQRIVVSNLSSTKQLKVRLKVSDLIFKENNKVVFTERLRNKPSTAGWLSVNKKQLLLKPKSSQQVLVTMQVPKGAGDSEHYAAILFETALGNMVLKQSGVNIGGRIGVLVLQKTPKEEKSTGAGASHFFVPKFLLSFGSQSLSIPFTFSFENTGNNHFNVKTVVKLKDMKNRLIAKKEYPEATAISGVKRVYKGNFSGLAPIGVYKTVADINYYGSRHFSNESVTYVVQGTLVIVIMAVFLILFFGVFTYLKLRKRGVFSK